jgi:hypothetical protein
MRFSKNIPSKQSPTGEKSPDLVTLAQAHGGERRGLLIPAREEAALILLSTEKAITRRAARNVGGK